MQINVEKKRLDPINVDQENYKVSRLKLKDKNKHIEKKRSLNENQEKEVKQSKKTKEV